MFSHEKFPNSNKTYFRFQTMFTSLLRDRKRRDQDNIHTIFDIPKLPKDLQGCPIRMVTPSAYEQGL